MSGVATHLGIDSNTIMLEAIRDFALETFNPTAIDRRLMPKLNEVRYKLSQTETYELNLFFTSLYIPKHGRWNLLDTGYGER